MPDPLDVRRPHPAGTHPAVVTTFRVAALATLLAVAMGSVVCATGSGAACPNWPGCQVGDVAPQWAFSPVVEFTHRVVAVLTGPLVLAAALASLRVREADRWTRGLPWLALAGAFASAVFGRLVIVSHLSRPLGAVDLFAALVCMLCTAVAAVRLEVSTGTWTPSSAAGTTRTALLASAGAALVVALHVLGIFAAGAGSFTRCLGWPMWRVVEADGRVALQAVRLTIAVAAALAVVAVAVVSRRDAALRPLGLAAVGLFVLEQGFGAWIRSHGLDRFDGTVYSVTAVLLLWTLGLVAARAAAQAPVAPQAGRELQPA